MGSTVIPIFRLGRMNSRMFELYPLPSPNFRTRMKISLIFCLLLVVFCSMADAKRYLVETVDSETSDPTPHGVETADSDLRHETSDPTQYEDLTENDVYRRRQWQGDLGWPWWIRMG